MKIIDAASPNHDSREGEVIDLEPRGEGAFNKGFYYVRNQ